MQKLKIKIIKYPESVLRKKCEEIEKITEEIKELIGDMKRIMIENKGIGLAAPQIGESKRIIVIMTEKGPEAFVNPKIIDKSQETEIMEEGCLSFPGLFFKIKRAKDIKIKATNINGNTVEISADGMLARIFQHEIDHLDGILFVDRLPFWQRLKLKIK